MNKRLIKQLQAFDALSLRERLLVALASLALPALVCHLLWLAPAEKQRLALLQQVAQAQATLVKLDTENRALEAKLNERESGLVARSTAMQQNLARQEAEFQALQARLMAPSAMPKLLQGLLNKRPGLQLLSLRSLAPQALAGVEAPASKPVTSPTAAAVPAPPEVAVAAPYYRHGLEITVQGSFADLLSYVEDVERLPQKLLWQQLRFKVDAYPRISLSLTLLTLSEDGSWLQL